MTKIQNTIDIWYDDVSLLLKKKVKRLISQDYHTHQTKLTRNCVLQHIMRFLWADHGIDDNDHDDDSNEMGFSLAQEEKYDRSLIAMKKYMHHTKIMTWKKSSRTRWKKNI